MKAVTVKVVWGVILWARSLLESYELARLLLIHLHLSI